MNQAAIHTQLRLAKQQGKKQLAVLIDPDKADNALLNRQLANLEKAGVELIFFGGSLLTKFELEERIGYIKERSSAKIILFPGSAQQISPAADAILFLSLISGRNPDLLIGQHVLAAPMLRQTTANCLRVLAIVPLS
jgi:putative glycerol-1-phosphate prenyltransferase